MNFYQTYPEFSSAYEYIVEHYGDKKAERSGVKLINHIDEGIKIMKSLGSTISTMDAFCLHPLIQNDADLEKNKSWITDIQEQYISTEALIFAFEYRNIANQYLSHRIITSLSDIKLSPFESVNQMLIADKVQNYKDFLIYHAGTHPRTDELNEYFNNWLCKLLCHDTFIEVLDQYGLNENPAVKKYYHDFY